MRGRARVLVVDDDADVQALLSTTLQHSGYVAAVADDADAASTAMETFRPDLAVVDVTLNGTDGFTFVRRLRDRSDIPVLFLSGRGEVDDRVEGFRSGGDDYLIKPFAREELLVRVEALLRRTGREISHAWQVDDLVVDVAAREVHRGGGAITLTKLEFELLDVLGRHPGQVWSKAALVEEVWGTELYDPNVVEAHISQVRKKLEAHGGRLIHTVRGVGYVLRASN